MFAEMRRQDRKLTPEEAEAILRNGQYGILPTTGEDGCPYGVPVSYAYENGKLYFHGTIQGGLKARNLEFSSRACFTVAGKTELLPGEFGARYESVIVFGTAAPAAYKREALMSLIRKYSADYPEAGARYVDAAMDRAAAWELTIAHISGKARKK